ncbi:MAG TPA: LysR substrate-binding domain-containing protein [Kiloniellales bacterium]|nr:LysR substrate-binding domain-containing protein [Kiloniellales bacterium]
MDIKGLRFFLGVLRYKSITKAAEHLYIAQPALGLQIRKLEAELGVQLLQRHSRGVTPTEAGLLLAEHAEIILRQVERAKQDLQDYAESPRGRVTVGMSPTTSQLLATLLAERIRQDLPEVKLNISEGLSEQLMEWVEKERIDIALTYNPSSSSDDMVIERLINEVLYFIAPGGRSKPAPTEIRLAEVLEHPLVLPSRPHLLRLLVDDAAKSTGAEAEVAYEVDSVPIMREFVRSGLGCSVLPFGAVRGEVAEGRLTARPIVGPEIQRTLYLAYSRARPPSKAFLAVIELIRTMAEEIVGQGTAGWRSEGTAQRGLSGARSAS